MTPTPRWGDNHQPGRVTELPIYDDGETDRTCDEDEERSDD